VIDVAKFGASLNTGTSFWAEEGEEILSSGRRILNEAGLDGLYTDKLLMGHPSRIIAAEADEGQYPLILLGARGLSPLKQLILGSVSSDVVHQVSKAIVGIVYP
jgi:nucleotide-binding universal stress UspA family protein